MKATQNLIAGEEYGRKIQITDTEAQQMTALQLTFLCTKLHRVAREFLLQKDRYEIRMMYQWSDDGPTQLQLAFYSNPLMNFDHTWEDFEITNVQEAFEAFNRELQCCVIARCTIKNSTNKVRGIPLRESQLIPPIDFSSHEEVS